MFSKILVPLDGSSLAEQALPYAVALARATGGRLVFLHVSSDLALAHQPTEEIDTAVDLDRMVDQLRRSRLAVASTLITGKPADSILTVARGQHVELIVMATHSRGGLGRWVYGSVADEVLRRAEVPVLLIPPVCEDLWPEGKRVRVLVPLDGSDLASSALGPASQLAEALGGDLLLARIVEPSYSFDTLGIPLLVPAGPDRLDAAREYLEGLRAALGPRVQAVEILVRPGDPVSDLPSIARDERVDLVAMATHGRSGLERLTLGSVATTMLRQTCVPLLLIGPKAIQYAVSDTAGPAARVAR